MNVLAHHTGLALDSADWMDRQAGSLDSLHECNDLKVLHAAIRQESARASGRAAIIRTQLDRIEQRTGDLLSDLAAILQAEDDRLMSTLELDDMAENVNLHVSSIVGAIAAELHSFAQSRDPQRLRELAEHITEWVSETADYDLVHTANSGSDIDPVYEQFIADERTGQPMNGW